MGELAMLKRQIPAVAKAIAGTEELLARSSGRPANVLEEDLESFKRRLAKIDAQLWKTTLYPCHCGLRMTQCPNRVGSMVCNLLDKGA